MGVREKKTMMMCGAFEVVEVCGATKQWIFEGNMDRGCVAKLTMQRTSCRRSRCEPALTRTSLTPHPYVLHPCVHSHRVTSSIHSAVHYDRYTIVHFHPFLTVTTTHHSPPLSGPLVEVQLAVKVLVDILLRQRLRCPTTHLSKAQLVLGLGNRPDGDLLRGERLVREGSHGRGGDLVERFWWLAEQERPNSPSSVMKVQAGYQLCIG